MIMEIIIGAVGSLVAKALSVQRRLEQARHLGLLD
jgi:uncharacterized membrane protein YeaQ/YmgE (transglycosylase-associated protein family)